MAGHLFLYPGGAGGVCTQGGGEGAMSYPKGGNCTQGGGGGGQELPSHVQRLRSERTEARRLIMERSRMLKIRLQDKSR